MARTIVRLFLLVATAEAISWAGLLIGMYVKYFTDGGERGVQIFGPIHGGIFVAYVVLALLVARSQRWSMPVTLAALVCSIPPFATLLFEWWAARTGRLSLAAPAQGEPQLSRS
jgi:integral membrane protein